MTPHAPDALTAKRRSDALRGLQQSAAWQGEWPLARKIAYNERRLERLAKQAMRRLSL